MTEQEVNELMSLACFGGGQANRDARRRLRDTLKSLIADGERLDHLEKNHWLDVMGQNRKYLEFLGHASKTLRQAIDERRVQA